MFEKHAMSLTGNSGKIYNFIVFPQDRAYEAAGAVYFVSICKPEERGTTSYNHSPIYLGQTDDLAREFADHPKAQCFRLAAESLKASPEDIAVGSILEKDAAKRSAVVADLEHKFKWVCNHWNP